MYMNEKKVVLAQDGIQNTQNGKEANNVLENLSLFPCTATYTQHLCNSWQIGRLKVNCKVHIL